MTITLSVWVIPAVITLGLLIWGFKVLDEESGQLGGGLGCLLPGGLILFVWCVFFAVMYFLK